MSLRSISGDLATNTARLGDTFVAKLKILALSVLVIVSNVTGNCLLNVSVKAGKFAGWVSVLRHVLSPTLIAGVLLLITWMLLRMALLSRTAMTLALPLTAGGGYLLTGAVSRLLFSEKVPVTYNYGLILITLGVLLVGSSNFSPDCKSRASDSDCQI